MQCEHGRKPCGARATHVVHEDVIPYYACRRHAQMAERRGLDVQTIEDYERDVDGEMADAIRGNDSCHD